MKSITSVIFTKKCLLAVTFFVAISISGFQLYKVHTLEVELNNHKVALQDFLERQESMQLALKKLGRTKIDFSESRKYEFEISTSYIDRDFMNGYWNQIVTTTIGGFDKKFGFTEYVIEPFSYSGDENEVETYLRREGGLGSWFYNLRTGDGVDVNSIDELLALIGKIDSEAEAASLVYMTIPDLLVRDGMLVGNTYELQDGSYLVQVTNKNTFGCGSHDSTKSIYLVTRDGKIDLYMSELEAPYKEGDLYICVD
jgi:hypothetical protein